MIIARIHNLFSNLTKTEKRIASYILTSPEKAVHITVKELAAVCDAAPSAITRLCASLGVDGFADLKVRLAADLANLNSKELGAFDKNDSHEAIFNKVFNSGVFALKNTLEMLDYNTVSKVIELLSKAKRILIFGVGPTAPVVQNVAHRFSQIGLQAYAYTDILYIKDAAMNMREGEVAMGISHSGKTRPIVDALRFAKEAGAQTVALTSFVGSLVYKESDFAISVFSDEETYPVEAISARIAHTCVIDAIIMCLVAENFEDFSHRAERHKKNMVDVSY